MRILFLGTSVGRQGTFFRWHNLAIGLKKLGHEVTVRAFDHHSFGLSTRTEEIDGITYSIRSGFRGQQLFGHHQHPVPTIRGCLDLDQKYDVVHAFQPFLTSALPWLVRRHSLAPLLVYDWDDLWGGGLLNGSVGGGGRVSAIKTYWTSWWTERLERVLPAKADHVTTCSRYLADMATCPGSKGHVSDFQRVLAGELPEQGQRTGTARFAAGLHLCRLHGTHNNRYGTGLASSGCQDCSSTSCILQDGSLRDAGVSLCSTILGKPRCGRLLRVFDTGKSKVFAAALDFGLLPLEDTPLKPGSLSDQIR